MIDLTADRIREVCGAALLAGSPSRSGDADAPSRAAVDSRAVAPGDLFFGIRGERSDGGEFARDAIDRGAWGVMVRSEHALRVAGSAGRARLFAVDDPLAALGRLARAWVDRLWSGGTKVVGITGSTGKTSTKDILRALITAPLDGAVHASPANYNTEIGLPLTVLETPEGTRALVLEMAMRGPGQIAELCEIAPPEVGVITNVGPVHLELLGTIEAVAEAKAELIAALPPHGFCVVPAAAEALRPHLRTEVRTLTFADWPHPTGEGALDDVDRVAGAAADIRVLSTERRPVADGDGLRVEIAFGAERLQLDFNFTQQHNVVNALAAVGAAYALGVPLEALAEGAQSIEMSGLRGDEVELAGGAVLFNDCYNANPVSMHAALDHLAELAAHRQAKRRVAVIGDMAELGPGAERYHRRIGELAAARDVDVLVAVGALAGGYLEGFGTAGETHVAADAEEAAAIVPGLIEPGDVVLLKASRSVGLERVADAVGNRRK